MPLVAGFLEIFAGVLYNREKNESLICVCTNGFRAGVDVVATKVGIILSSSYFFFFFLSSMHLLFSQKGFTYEFEFLHAFLSNKEMAKMNVCITL